MISLKPIAPEALPALAEEAGLAVTEALAGVIASDGTHTVGTLFYLKGEPVRIIALTAEDAGLADGLCRAALYPLYAAGAREYSLDCRPGRLLPPCYPAAGRGELAALFGKNC